jgi:hypothetical protein
MQRPGWNATRRNRNIGTAKQGHGQDNRLVIPSDWRDLRRYWERLSTFTVVTRPVYCRDLPFVVEPTRADSVYACTIDDIATVLHAAPKAHVAGIQGVVLRQPKRKEEILSPVWGRLGYSAEVGPILGPTIVVEAIRLPLTLRYSARLGVPEQEELKRLLPEADRVEQDGRCRLLHFGLSGVRRVQLYRTVLHELGHWADYFEKVERPSRRKGGDWGALRDAYWQRPANERESFAHRYARELAEGLKARRLIPFERVLSLKQLKADGLSPEDFVWGEGEGRGSSA